MLLLNYSCFKWLLQWSNNLYSTCLLLFHNVYAYAMPTNDVNYSFHIKAIEPIWSII